MMGHGILGALLTVTLFTSIVPSDALELAGFGGLGAEGHTGAGAVVAVVDTGIDAAHPAFSGRITEGWDFVDGDNDPADGNGHGTHVAGIVAAAADSQTPGGAPEATIMPVRVLDDSGAGSNDTVAQGILWAAEHGADVINLSIGDAGPADRFRKGGPVALAIRAVSTQATVVVAAGNDAQYEQLFRAGVDALVVVATDPAGQPAPFTNVGDSRAVAAPGVDIRSTALTTPSIMFPQGTDGYATLSGTSMAAPFVSAEAALLAAIGLTPTQTRTAVTGTAVNTTGDPRLGAGIIDARGAVTSVTAASGETPVASPATASPPTPTGAVATDPAANAPEFPWLLTIAGGALVVIAITVTIAVTRHRDGTRTP